LVCDAGDEVDPSRKWSYRLGQLAKINLVRGLKFLVNSDSLDGIEKKSYKFFVAKVWAVPILFCGRPAWLK